MTILCSRRILWTDSGKSSRPRPLCLLLDGSPDSSDDDSDVSDEPLCLLLDGPPDSSDDSSNVSDVSSSLARMFGQQVLGGLVVAGFKVGDEVGLVGGLLGEEVGSMVGSGAL